MEGRQQIPRQVLLVVGLGTFLAQLDGTVMNVALPALSRSFHTAALSSVQPVITAYLVTSVALLPVLGKTADRFGRKRLFLLGLAVFGMASLLAAFSASIAVLVALRILQAIGGALLSGTSLAIVAAASESGRGKSLGQLSVVYALSGLIGPPLGGAVVQLFGWPAVFWINVPLCVCGLVVGVQMLPADGKGKAGGSLDLVGTALFAVGTTLITAGVASSQSGIEAVGGAHLAWPSLLVLGAAVYLALVWWEVTAQARHVDVLLDMRLLRSRAYGLGLMMAFVNNGVSIALFVLVPFWLAKGWHVAAGAQGLVFLPVALGLGALAPMAGKRSDLVGSRLLTTLGMCAGTAAALLLAWQATLLVWPVVAAAMLLLGAANGLFGAPNNNAVLSAAPTSALAVAGSMLSAARTLGVILGVAVFSAAYDALRADHGNNPAARLLFLAAAGLFALNALLCWTGRDPQPAASLSERLPGKAREI